MMDSNNDRTKGLSSGLDSSDAILGKALTISDCQRRHSQFMFRRQPADFHEF